MEQKANNRGIVIDQFGLKGLIVKDYVISAAKSFGVNQGTQAVYNGKVPQPVGISDDPLPFKSALGTAVWDTLIIKEGSYIENGLTVKYNEMRFDSCLISINQTHNVVITSTQGGTGEVIEFIGKGNFRISVKGGLFGGEVGGSKKGANSRPAVEIINLSRMLGSNQPLTVKSCGFLSEWNISEFDILYKEIPQSMGGYNYQLFNFEAIQDIPVILAQRNA